MSARSIISGSGSYVPPVRVPNDAFLDRDFWMAGGKRIEKSNEEILEQFAAITGIAERRYAPDHMFTSDMAFEAAKRTNHSGVRPKRTLKLGSQFL